MALNDGVDDCPMLGPQQRPLKPVFIHKFTPDWKMEQQWPSKGVVNRDLGLEDYAKLVKMTSIRQASGTPLTDWVAPSCKGNETSKKIKIRTTAGSLDYGRPSTSVCADTCDTDPYFSRRHGGVQVQDCQRTWAEWDYGCRLREGNGQMGREGLPNRVPACKPAGAHHRCGEPLPPISLSFARTPRIDRCCGIPLHTCRDRRPGRFHLCRNIFLAQ